MPNAYMGQTGTYMVDPTSPHYNITYGVDTQSNLWGAWFGTCSCRAGSYVPHDCNRHYNCYEPSCKEVPDNLCKCTK